jgi:hypothetical protein
MEIVAGAIGVIIIIIIGMLFGRIMGHIGLIFEGIVKLIKKLF